MYRRGQRGPARSWWAAFFWAVALGALLGGVGHGFPPAHAAVGVALWRLTLLAIGAAALCAWGAGAYALATAHTRAIVAGGAALFAVYAGIILFVTDAFEAAMAHYAVGATFLLVVLLRVWSRTRARAPLVGALGLVALAGGSVVQWRRLGLPSLLLTHNAVYHLVEMVALVLLYRAARGLTSSHRC